MSDDQEKAPPPPPPPQDLRLPPPRDPDDMRMQLGAVEIANGLIKQAGPLGAMYLAVVLDGLLSSIATPDGRPLPPDLQRIKEIGAEGHAAKRRVLTSGIVTASPLVALRPHGPGRRS